MSNGATPGPAILDQAARWFVLLASGEASATDRARWQAWRAADARHEQAWQRTQAATARLRDIPREQAHVSVAALNQRTAPKSPGRRRALGQLAVLFAVGLTGWQGWRRSDWSADQLTAVGEQRDITLADGSLLRLDTDSAIDIAFTAGARLIHLRRGRIMIKTAAAPEDGQRRGHPPFLVETAEGRVRALGTRFSVQQEAGSTRVAVLEARVAVQAADVTGEGAGDAPILQAGQDARFDRQGIVAPYPRRPADAAWTKGMLIADDLPLADFIAELARYRDTPLRCDPAVQALRISGTFPLRDTDRALAALGHTLPVRMAPIRQDDPRSGVIIRAK